FKEYILEKDERIASWLGLESTELVTVVRKTIELYEWISYKKLSKQQITSIEELFYYGSEESSDIGKTNTEKQEILLSTECGTLDYVEKQESSNKENAKNSDIKMERTCITKDSHIGNKMEEIKWASNKNTKGKSVNKKEDTEMVQICENSKEIEDIKKTELGDIGEEELHTQPEEPKKDNKYIPLTNMLEENIDRNA
ncbi:20159_t:CDS:2, partial [Gigaspora rosea]